MNKDITIVIPVYNSEKYIARCLESLLNQTIDNYKLLVINDGSKDNSKKIIEEYKNNYSEIIEVINQENKGVANTRNFATKNTDTEYIMFIDNDDYVDKDYVETLYNEIKKEKCDAIFSGYRRTNNALETIETNSYNYIDEWSKFKILSPWAKIYKRKFLIDNDIKFLNNNIGEDIYFNLNVIYSGKIKLINYVGYNWFYNDESVSNSKQKNWKNINVFELLNNCYDKLKKDNRINDNYIEIEGYFYKYIIWFLLFSTKNCSYKDIKIIQKKLINWIKERFPKYYKNKYLTLKNPKSESKKERLIYCLFNKFNRLGLGTLYIYLYNKR